MGPHKISEYIENLPLEKSFCKGYKPDEVYAVICNISSMYNQILSEAYQEIDEMKRELEHEKTGHVIQSGFQNRAKDRSIIIECTNKTEVEKERSESHMTDKEIQRLKRGELLEVLLEQSKENEALKLQLEAKEQAIKELEKKLENRKIEIANAGSLAEASFKLNGVFDAAEKAAQQYLENLKELHDKESSAFLKKEAEIENRCSALLHATQERCDFMKEDVAKMCENMELKAREQCDNMLKETEVRCRQRETEAEEKCRILDQKAKTDVDKRWDDLSKRLEEFYVAHEGLKELLATSKMI